MSRRHDTDLTRFLLERSGYPIVFGHRGFSAAAPENTLAAFAKLREHSIEGVEFDIHQCAGGEIVVIHDNDLNRVGGVQDAVADTRLDQLREHDVGRWFSDEFADERIPTLEQVFELLGDTVLYDIEIKHHGVRLCGPQQGGIEERLLYQIHRFGLERRCFVSSFDPLAMRRMAQIAPDIPRSVIYVDAPDLPRLLRHGQGRFICGATILKPQQTQATRSLIRRNGRRGRSVVTWTVDDPGDAKNLAELGVSGIVTNNPGTIQAVLR